MTTYFLTYVWERPARHWNYESQMIQDIHPVQWVVEMNEKYSKENFVMTLIFWKEVPDELFKFDGEF